MKLNKLEVAEYQGLEDVRVFWVMEGLGVAAYSLNEAREWIMNYEEFDEDELEPYDLVEVTPLDKKVRDSEDNEELVTVREIIRRYWEGKPFIALTTL